jgi:hypothetical protein
MRGWTYAFSTARRGVLVFADHGPRFAAAEDSQGRIDPRERAGDPSLVPRLAPGMQKRHDDDLAARGLRLGTAAAISASLGASSVSPRSRHPLRDREHVLARHERRRSFAEQAVGIGHAQTRELQDVGEARSREERDTSAGPLDDPVDAHRRAVDEVGDLAERKSALGQAAQSVRDVAARFGRRRRDRRDDTAVAVDGCKVGKRAADVGPRRLTASSRAG